MLADSLGNRCQVITQPWEDDESASMLFVEPACISRSAASGAVSTALAISADSPIVCRQWHTKISSGLT